MPNPEEGEVVCELEFKPRHKVMAASLALVASVALALSVHGKSESLAEQCSGAYPPDTPGLTIEDYFNVERGQDGKYYPSYDDRDVIAKLLQEQVDAYQISSERNDRIASKVADYATVMVGRANLGINGYEFYRPGDPGDGWFYGDPKKPVPDDFEGYGWLWRNVKDENGDIVQQEITDGIYRFSDGTYATNPSPGTLSVFDKQSQAVFNAPQNLGLTECSSIDGNGTTQGWRVEYYDFWPEGEAPSPGDIQDETFNYFQSSYYYPGEMELVKDIEDHAFAKIQASAVQ